MKQLNFRAILSKKEIELYHGSDVVVKEPKIIQPVRALDFGSGFYTTTNIEQAKSFSKRVQERNASSNAIISVYLLDCSLLAKMKYLYFDNADKEWLDFVSANRNGTYEGTKYDVIYGPVANDTIFRTFIAYQNGILNAEETIKRLKISNLYNQIVFASEKSFECFSYIKEF